jgi:energy-converting hydrogenase Eha subunit B
MMHEWGISYGFGLGPLGMLVLAALLVWPFWRICEKAGYPGLMALLVFVPIVNLIFLYWFAFADWPNLKKAEGEA